MINEHFDEYPEGLIDTVRKNIEEIRKLKLVPNYHLYIYLDGLYGDQSAARKYAREFPASITGGTKATRFRSESSYARNKIYIDEGKKYVVFLSPTYGGVNIFGDWIPYRH